VDVNNVESFEHLNYRPLLLCLVAFVCLCSIRSRKKVLLSNIHHYNTCVLLLF
jgi:hypothetical protein